MIGRWKRAEGAGKVPCGGPLKPAPLQPVPPRRRRATRSPPAVALKTTHLSTRAPCVVSIPFASQVGAERFMAPEAIFNPDLIGVEGASLCSNARVRTVRVDRALTGR